MKVNVVTVSFFAKSHANILTNSKLGNTQDKLRIMEQHLPDVSQKFMHNNNLDCFYAQLASKITQTPSPLQCHEIIFFLIISTVNPIGLMKTWGKLSFTLCMKEIINIIDQYRCRYRKLINSFS